MNGAAQCTSTEKYFGHICPEADGVSYSMHVVKEAMTQENVDEFQELTSVVFDLQPVLFAYELNRRNYTEIGDELRRCLSRMSPTENFGSRFCELPEVELYIGPAQRIGNFLASAYAFLSNAEQDLIERYGKKSTHLNEWSNFRRAQHLKSFAYRLLYSLRNSSQHQMLPVTGINATAAGLLDDSDPKIAFDIYLDRDALLAARGNYLKSNEADLRVQDARFSMTPLINQYFVDLRAICRRFIELEAPRLDRCERYFQTMERIFKWPEGCLPVIFDGMPTKRELQNPNDFDFELSGRVSIIPVAQFLWIRDLYHVLRLAPAA